MKQQGFNLMELMVSVAIIGVIVAIAVPAYSGHVQTTRRTAASACMTELAQFMERVYTTSMSYAVHNNQPSALPDTGCRVDLADFYTFKLEREQQTFTITATPKGNQLKDTTCGILSLNQAGTRTAAGVATPEKIRACWS